MQDETPCPVKNATQPLEALQSLCAPLNAAQRAEVKVQLQAAIDTLADPIVRLDANQRLLADERLLADTKLLSEVIADITQDPHQTLHECLSVKTFSLLKLENLPMKTKYEAESSSRTFNSILILLAGYADNHGTLGRTLLWEGAGHLVGEHRKDTLKTVMFDLKIDESGGLPFEYAADVALDKQGLYEKDEKDVARS